MKIMASVEERLKLKRGQIDTWSTREKLCLASSVVRSGNQNWMSVSRSLRGFGGEPGRPADWFSQKSCAVQYDNLLTQIETPKRKKRGADGPKSEGPDLTPAEVIVKQLTSERIEELRKLMAEVRAVYMREKEEIYLVDNGLADDRLEDMLAQIEEEKKQKGLEQEEHQRWLKQREERKQEMEMAWRPHAVQQHHRGPTTQSARRPSNQSELGSEAENEIPSSTEQPLTSEDVVETKAPPTPASPLLTSLLKSPSPVTGTQSSSILHSAITSQRGASPTITSLLNSSPGIPSTTPSVPLSPSRKTLVSNALSGQDDVPKPQSHGASSSPTLSMLLERLPSTPGKPHELPYCANKQPASTSSPATVTKTGGMLNKPIVDRPKSSEQHVSSGDQESKSKVIAVPSGHIQDVFQSFPDLSCQISSSLDLDLVKEPLQRNPIFASSSDHDSESTDKVVVADVNSGSDLDPMSKEPVPQTSVDNMGIVLSVEADTMTEEQSKVILETSDLQQLSSADVEYVVEPSIDGDLQEFSPGGLMDEIAGYIDVSTEDVEASVSHMLEAVESDDVSGNVALTSENELNNVCENVHVEEQKELEAESQPSFVTVHSLSTQQSPQQASATMSSALSSPRNIGRPSKGNIVARKIVMEEEQLPKFLPEDDKKLEGDGTTLSREELESASILFVQDNGEVVKLSESGEATEVLSDIRVIQDSANSVVLVPHDNVLISKNSYVNESTQSPVKDNLSNDLVVGKDICTTPKTDPEHSDVKPAVRTPRKIIDKKDNSHDSIATKKIDDDAKTNVEVSLRKVPDTSSGQTMDEDTSRLEEEKAEVEFSDSSKTIGDHKKDESEKRLEVSSPKEIPRKQKSLSLSKKDKAPVEVAHESSNEMAPEDNHAEEELKKEFRKDADEVKESVEEISECVQVEQVSQPLESESRVSQIKEEKMSRAETPSTEDDNTRDADPPQTYRGRRGRYGRDSIANSDSVPNSPIPSNVSLDEEKDHRAWKKSIMLVYNRIAAHKNASIFLRPITDDKAPGYSTMIFRRLDLQTIKKNVESGITRSTEEFQRDVLIMFNNAIMYNKSNSPIYVMAREMQEEGVAHLQEFMNTQLLVKNVGSEGSHLPSRRGTRTAEKRDQDFEGTRRGLLGKRKRSLPDDKSTPKRRKDGD